MVFPRMYRVKQQLEGPMLHDISGAVRETIRSLRLQERVKPGQTVAITAGSREIANIDRITGTVVNTVQPLYKEFGDQTKTGEIIRQMEGIQ